MTRSLLLALALARAVALLDSPETPGLRGTISEAAEPAGQYSVRSKGRKLDFGYQDFFVGPLDDPFNDAMKAKATSATTRRTRSSRRSPPTRCRRSVVSTRSTPGGNSPTPRLTGCAECLA